MHTLYLAIIHHHHHVANDHSPAHAAGQVGGQVGAVLEGGAPTPGAEGAAHPEAPSAGALGHARPLRALLFRVARAIEPQPRAARCVGEAYHGKQIEKPSMASLVCLNLINVH